MLERRSHEQLRVEATRQDLLRLVDVRHVRLVHERDAHHLEDVLLVDSVAFTFDA